MRKFIFNLFLISILFGCSAALSCTNLKIKYRNQYLIAHNFDWPDKYAFIVINPPGIKRQAIQLSNAGVPLHWVSKYASVTINMAYHIKPIIDAVPTGMNQYGLTASVLWLQHSHFPNQRRKAELGTAQWTQYFLDNAKNVSDAVNLAKNLIIVPTEFQKHKVLVHLILHDANGDSAIMEYHHGKLVIYHGQAMPLAVLTNNPYTESTKSLAQYKAFGGKKNLPNGFLSPSRFVHAVYFLKNTPTLKNKPQAVATAFNALNYVSEPPGSAYPTSWSVVYDLSTQTFYYRDVNNFKIRSVNLHDFNLKKNNPIQFLFLNNQLNGNVDSYFVRG